MSETYDYPCGAHGPAGVALQGTRILQAAPGASTSYVSDANANADFGNTHILALRPLPSNRIDIVRPAAAAQNSVLIAAIGFRPPTLTVTAPAGWTLVHRMDNTAGTPNALAVYRRVVSAPEPAGYRWSFSGGTLEGAAGGIQTFSGVDTANPIDAVSGQSTPSDTIHATRASLPPRPARCSSRHTRMAHRHPGMRPRG